MRKVTRSSEGFTLIEVLVALSIFALVSAVMAPSFVAHLRYNHDTAIQSGALAAAQQMLDEIRAVNPESLPTGGTSPVTVIEIGPRSYQALVSYCLRPDLCSARSRHITVAVSLHEEVVYEVETVFTRLR